MLLPCGHHESNGDVRLESGTPFCWRCQLEEMYRDAAQMERELSAENARLREELRGVYRVVDARIGALVTDADDHAAYHACDGAHPTLMGSATIQRLRGESWVCRCDHCGTEFLLPVQPPG